MAGATGSVKDWPAGMGQIGDRVWYLEPIPVVPPAYPTDAQCKAQQHIMGELVEVGLTNTHGHDLNIAILLVDGRRIVVHPDCSDSSNEPRWFIIPPDGEVPEFPREWAEENDAVMVRRPRAVSPPAMRYRPICPDCYAALDIGMTCEEAADFYFDDEHPTCSKPMITNSWDEIICRCADKARETPDEFEVYN